MAGADISGLLRQGGFQGRIHASIQQFGSSLASTQAYISTMFSIVRSGEGRQQFFDVLTTVEIRAHASPNRRVGSIARPHFRCQEGDSDVHCGTAGLYGGAPIEV